MQAVSDFFAMGGHAGYIWPAFAVTFVGMVGLLFATLRGWRQSEQMLRSLRQERRRMPAAGDGPQRGAIEGDGGT